MGDRSAIEWTDATWNPIRGCSRVSEGCRNCYAERTAIRQRARAYAGLVKSTPSGPRWTGEVRLVEEALTLPLRWKMPRRVFVNSMSDLFHEKVASEWVDRIFGVMAQTPRHTYQVLTKRAETMLSYCGAMAAIGPKERSRRIVASMYRGHPAEYLVRADEHTGDFRWPLPNVWLGVSVENQAAADERVPVLLRTPAAVRFLSIEPLLSYVGLEEHWLLPTIDAITRKQIAPRIDWVIVGGESGPGARPCDLAWIRSVVAQCRAAGVPVFVKQLGAKPFGPTREREPRDWIGGPMRLRDRKGGELTEWPADLRVRELPA